MLIEYLSLKNFRNYTRLETALPKGCLLLCGQNAQGKTNLLEAIYYLATSTSLYATSERQLMNWRIENEPLPFAQVSAEVLSRHQVLNRLSITLQREEANTPQERFKKTLQLNGVVKRRADVLGLVNVVLFVPQDLLLVEGPPSERRRYMNSTLAQVDPVYTEALAIYEKVLLQRNALLRHIQQGRAGAAELEYWDKQLATHAATLIAGRQRFLREVEYEAAKIYRELSGKREDLRLVYVPNFEPTFEGNGQRSFGLNGLDLHRELAPEAIIPQFEDYLRHTQREEIERGQTLVGPQRDELRFYVNERDLGLYGSRGQARTGVLALKLAELAWMEAKISDFPILLLDEVASELDQERRAYLLERVRTVSQAILTTTEPNIFSADFLSAAQVWRVRAGQIEA
jgi:DNA replication and repair protein RecF